MSIQEISVGPAADVEACVNGLASAAGELEEASAEPRHVEEDRVLVPYDKPYRLENWPDDDLVAYCGGHYLTNDMRRSK